ncbi:hypothetical protein M0R45_015510 [Rubus argutus]|uniref:CCHC-type domain-containing protein n=1 Tax=Rubus argutus TaxID=59490 RepID=A0AAW1XSA2_RUBAR
MMANTSLFTFFALPVESGREELPSLGQNKRSRCDDVLGDKLQATQTTVVELDSPLPGPPIVDSYATQLLNPLSQYGKVAVEDFEMTDEDYQIKPGSVAPNCCFSQRVKDKLELEWRCAVIIKLMGKPNSSNTFTFMFNSLKRKWKPQGPWQLIDLPIDFYIVKFHLHDDMNARGKFGRLCIEIDLNKPLLPFVETEGTAYGVVYEGISLICFNCGCYGHAKANCPYNITEPHPTHALDGSNNNLVNNSPSAAAEHCENRIPHNIDNNVTSPQDIGSSDSKLPKSPESGGHSPWMLMSYKNKKFSSNNAPENMKPAQFGSRYALLETFVEGGENALRDAKPTAVEELTKPTTLSEPSIINVWKAVQKKMKKNNSTKTSATNGTQNSKPVPATKTNTNLKKALKDITNGKAHAKILAPRFNVGSSSCNPKDKSPINSQNGRSNHSRSTKISECSNIVRPTPSTVENSHTLFQFSTTFGHCPPEDDPIEDISCTIMEISATGNESNDQVNSDLTLNVNQTDGLCDIVDNSDPSSNVEDMVDA